jgi:hypothetical protein
MNATDSPKWIINRRSDLILFFGGVGLAYPFLAASIYLPAAAFILVTTLWITVVDAPHQFATATRTYFDREARPLLGWKMFAVVPFVLLGPAMWSVGLAWLYGVLVLSWGTFHIAKQHMGFMFIYKKKARDFADAKLDKYFLLSSLLLPAAWFTVLRLIPLMRYATVRALTVAAFTAYFTFAAYYVLRLIRRRTNTPQMLLFAVVIPLHWLAFIVASDLPIGRAILVSSVAQSMGHAVQYHGLMWFHNRNRYAGNYERHGLATTLSRKFLFYAAVSIAMYLPIVLCYRLSKGYGLEWLALAATGPSLTHYFLDSFIWRTREDKELAAALRL